MEHNKRRPGYSVKESEKERHALTENFKYHLKFIAKKTIDGRHYPIDEEKATERFVSMTTPEMRSLGKYVETIFNKYIEHNAIPPRLQTKYVSDIEDIIQSTYGLSLPEIRDYGFNRNLNYEKDEEEDSPPPTMFDRLKSCCKKITPTCRNPCPSSSPKSASRKASPKRASRSPSGSRRVSPKGSPKGSRQSYSYNPVSISGLRFRPTAAPSQINQRYGYQPDPKPTRAQKAKMEEQSKLERESREARAAAMRKRYEDNAKKENGEKERLALVHKLIDDEFKNKTDGGNKSRRQNKKSKRTRRER
jgi:hypothetical protein